MAHGISDDLAARLAAYQDRMEEAQRRGPSSLAEAFERPPAGLGCHEIDAGTRVLRANDGDVALLGYAREELVGRPIVDFIVMDETARRAIGRKIAGELELKPFVRTFRHKDGSAVPLALLDRPLRDASGRVIGLRTVVARVDSTES